MGENLKFAEIPTLGFSTLVAGEQLGLSTAQAGSKVQNGTPLRRGASDAFVTCHAARPC
jgi:hypothetical protein